MRDSYTAPYNIANPNTNNKTALILSPRMTLGWETRSRTYSTAPSAHRASILTRCHLQYFHKTTTRLYRVYRASRSSREKTEHQQMQQLQNIEDFLCANLGHGQRQAILHPLMLYHLAARQLLCPWREYHTGTAEDWRRRRDLADLNGDGYGLLSKTWKLSQHGSRVSKATCTKPCFVNQTVVETATYSTTSQ